MPTNPLPDARLEAANKIYTAALETGFSVVVAPDGKGFPQVSVGYDAAAMLSTALRVTQADALAAALRSINECPIPFGGCVLCRDASTKVLAAYDALQGEG